MTSTAAFETSFGNAYLGIAVSRVAGVGDDLDALPGIDVRQVTVARTGGPERDCRVMVGVEYVAGE